MRAVSLNDTAFSLHILESYYCMYIIGVHMPGHLLRNEPFPHSPKRNWLLQRKHMELPTQLSQTGPPEHTHQYHCMKKCQFPSYSCLAMLWDEILRGNYPTKSDAVNGAKNEVRGEGAASHACCSIEWDEFISILVEIQKLYPCLELKDLILSYFGRVDNVMELEKSSLNFNHWLPFMLLCNMTWSKILGGEGNLQHNYCFQNESIVLPIVEFGIFGDSCTCWIAYIWWLLKQECCQHFRKHLEQAFYSNPSW